MKAIIIEEDRFVDLTNNLKLAREDLRVYNTQQRLNIDKDIWSMALDEAHRRYHYEVVRWAQSHGASCVPKY